MYYILLFITIFAAIAAYFFVSSRFEEWRHDRSKRKLDEIMNKSRERDEAAMKDFHHKIAMQPFNEIKRINEELQGRK